VGDLSTEARLLHQMAMLDLQGRRTEDAAVHLQEGLLVAPAGRRRHGAAQRPGLLRAPVRRDQALR
jgi:hypothetical protein